jgi:hypothetical protein
MINATELNGGLGQWTGKVITVRLNATKVI